MGGGDGFLDLLQNLGREEMMEVLSDDGGFCQHCQALLRTRIQNQINNRKLRELSVNGSSAGSKISEPSARKPSSSSIQTSDSEISVNDGVSSLDDIGLLGEQNEHVRFAEVGRKKNFNYVERIYGKPTNLLQGLELHTRVFNAEEQQKIVECVYQFQRMGRKGQLRARTYSEPRKWMRGKGRITIQFGCCYNYAVDKNGNPPGILRQGDVDPIPLLFKQMIKRMVRWHVLPPTCVPNSCIVNIYGEGDCIPPHIDHHDFLRPFCTVSFLTECNILFGSNLKSSSPGEFEGPVSIPLPVGSVLILSGNGADIAKHCVSGVERRRISITFRKMDESKLPYNYLPEPELQGIKPLVYSPLSKSPVQQNQQENFKFPAQRNQHENFRSHVQQNQHENKKINDNKPGGAAETSNNLFAMQKDDFPPLGSLSSVNRQRTQQNNFKR
ncbi:RNA demethylase ALKBH9B-like [Cornus florida]|uniref:RNA demethylase ALKBH9B-like n=1 Tax=Cornus florida TaxID=4283 RepID=UPI00289E685F|nr:RNA demethylase ALKBH9B-like [Cornus florida]